MTDRSEECAEIVNCAEEDAADEHPEHDWHPAEDRRLDRAVDGACACDRREVMAEHYIRSCRNVILAVLQFMGRCLSLRVNAPRFASHLP